MFSLVRRYPFFRKAVIVIFTLPLMFTGGAFLGGLAQQQNIGEVDSLDIPRSEFVSRYQNLLERYRRETGVEEISEDIQQYIVRQVQNDLLSSYLLHASVKSKGVRAPDSVVAKEIRDIPNFQDDDGNFSVDIYEEQVQDRRYYQEQVRDSVGRRPLLWATTYLPMPAVDRKMATLRRQKRTVDESKIPIQLLTSLTEATLNITTEQINDYYRSNANDYAILEEATFEYFTISLDEFAAGITLTIGAAESAYEDYIAEWDEQRRMRVRHIYVSDEALAKEIYQTAAANPDDFPTIAGERSEDSGSARQGGLLGILTDGDLPEELNETLLTMTAGQIHPPIETDDGFSILKLDEVITTPPPPFADVEEKMHQRARRDFASEEFELKVEELSDLAPVEIGSLENMAKEVNASVAVAVSVYRDADENDAPFNDDAVLIDVFDPQVTAERENSTPIPFGDDAYLFVRAQRYQAAGLRPLQEVAPEISTKLRGTQLAELLYQRVAEERAEETTGEETLDLLKGLSWTTTHTVILANDEETGEEDAGGLDSIDSDESERQKPAAKTDDEAEDSDELNDITLDRLYIADLQYGLPAYVFEAKKDDLRIFRIREIEEGDALEVDHEIISDLLSENTPQLGYLGYLDDLSEQYQFQFYNLPSVTGQPEQQQ